MNFKEYMGSSGVWKVRVHQLLNIIKNIITIPKNEHKAHDNTEKFWLDSKIYEWLEKHGMTVERGIVPPYEEGGAGRAYFVDNKVVKMSANRVEANVAAMLIGHKDFPIIDVMYLDNNIYAILEKYLNMNVPKSFKDAADLFTVLIDEYETLPPNYKELCLKIAKQYNRIDLESNMVLVGDMLWKLYQHTGFVHDDAGPTNIGLLRPNNKLTIHDFGPNEPKGFDQLDALAKIQKNREKLGLPKWKMQ